MVISKAEQHLKNRQAAAPVVSNLGAKSVSQYRRETLNEELEEGHFREGSGNPNAPTRNQGPSPAGFVTYSSDGPFKKSATLTSGSSTGSSTGSGGGYRGPNNVTRQALDLYSPLWLNSNLNLPRDRATINAWSRAFFALNGYVQNAILLHSTYPISKLNIKCKHPKVEKFFADMIEEIDLRNICIQIAQEYWVLGEAFVYAELDNSNKKWSRLLIQNPDYIMVERSPVSSDPIISLKPDSALRKICTSNRPADLMQRQKLDPAIVEHVRRGENIPLDNFYVSQIARKINPYDSRGTGLIVSSFKPLMAYDKIYECHDEQTEVLTDQGWKRYEEVIEYRMSMDGTYNLPYVSSCYAKPGIKIACFNPETEYLEYHQPSNTFIDYHQGDMYHFSNKKMDLMVTGDHDLWVSKRKGSNKNNIPWGEWGKVKAKELPVQNYFRTRACVNWEGEEVKSTKVCGKDIPMENYLEFLGYLLSEGSLYERQRNYCVAICQSTITEKRYYPRMRECIETFAEYLEVKNRNCIRETNGMWSGSISNKDLYTHFKSEIGTDGSTLSPFKHVPQWVLNLSPRLLGILLKAAMDGDGHVSNSRKRKIKHSKYTTTSKQLADNIHEIALKCGYAPLLRSYEGRKGRLPYYEVSFSEKTAYSKGFFPQIHEGHGKRDRQLLKIEKYSGFVWCFEVPTGLFVTRRNGKITVQGNCKFAQYDNMVNPLTLVKVGGPDYKPTPADLEAWRNIFSEAQFDKDFKIFTHEAVAVERVGANAAILDTSGDITQLVKTIYTGLLVPSVLLDGGADTTYANGSVALDVLRQRYEAFRNMLTFWLRRKIFAPISKINDFYEYRDKEKVLIVPEVEWNHMSLFDMGDYINTLLQLATAEGKRVSYHTLYRSLGLSIEDENLKIKKEDIQEAIRTKEKESLAQMSLNELRALTPTDEISEPAQSPLPGEEVPGEGGGGEPGPPPGLEIPGPPPAPPAPPPPPGPV